MNETHYCHECERLLSPEESHEFDGVYLCEECYRGRTVECDSCGDRIWREDCESDGTTYLCNRCWSDRYTTCDDCGSFILNDEAYYDDCGDDRYCRECYYKRKRIPIKSYNYKPTPLFYGGDSDLYLGIELEIDHGGEDNENATRLLEIANHKSEHMYCKHDGSISSGFEMVSHPMTLSYHKEKMPWNEIFSEAISLDYRSHNTDTCGLHIHVNRDAFGESEEEQEACISRIVFFVEKHWDDLVQFSRRKLANLNRWAARYATISTTAKETYKKAKDSHAGRYAAVNLTNYETVEFRLFRGTLRHETFMATLQLVAFLCNLSRFCSDRDFETMSWRDFVLKISPDKMPELVSYLKLRQLYVNEPAQAMGEEV